MVSVAALGGGALFSLLSLSSCGGSANEEFFSFQTFSLKTTAVSADADSAVNRDRKIDFDGRWEVTTSGVMPVKVGPNPVDALCDTLSVMACADLSQAQPVISLPKELRLPDGKEALPDSVPLSRLMKRLTVDMVSPEVAVFRVYTYAYPEGAAHGVYSNRFINYDVAGGSVLSLDSLFVSGYRRTLQPEIVKRLKENHSRLLVEDDEVEVSPVFRLTDDGVELIYGIYSVAPYSDGEPIVAFKPYELLDILSPTGKRLLTAD